MHTEVSATQAEVILYTPFLAKIFAVCPLDWHDWATWPELQSRAVVRTQFLKRVLNRAAEVLVMAFSFPVIILDEVLKFFGRQYQNHKDVTLQQNFVSQ